MKKNIKIFALLMGWSICSLAHEFWIGLSKYKVEANGSVAVQFYVGEDFKGEVWPARKTRTGKVTHFSMNKEADITKQFINDSLPVTINNLSAGTHVITMESQASYIEMKADKFNAYLEEDGIADIAALRMQHNELDKDSRELYQRCAKTILQAGNIKDTLYKMKAGFMLELIPQKNPYSLKIADHLPVLVLFNKKPLANYKVRVWNRYNDKLNTGIF